MNKIKIVSDGTTEGTQVFLPDGTEIAAGAYAVQVNIGQEAPPHVVLTFLLGEMTPTPEPEPPKPRPPSRTNNTAPGAI